MPRAYVCGGASSKSVKKCTKLKSSLKPYKNNGFWQERRVKKCTKTTVSSKPLKGIGETTFPAWWPSAHTKDAPLARPQNQLELMEIIRFSSVGAARPRTGLGTGGPNRGKTTISRKQWKTIGKTTFWACSPCLGRQLRPALRFSTTILINGETLGIYGSHSW